ncbi:hypothetical protein OpiT1DRAFT_04349 [Opitutaceae bacterium TAV1]|nr:hypothetical protein OpiT1DRAFT_04349 [Opitutaceae bacterium TAV1]
MSTHNSTGIAALLTALAMTGATAFGITIDTVTVGYAGNAADTASGTYANGRGAVSYEYQIGTYEVTNAQYAAFLNAVDSTGANTYSLYNSNMSSSTYGGITWNSTSSKYEVKAGFDLKPVNYVSFYDAARFVNWLTNGQGSGGTESGLYVFKEGKLVSTPDHATSTGWVIPNENEWYKAAYYNPTLNEGAGGYTNYPWAGGASPSHTQDAVNGATYSGGPGNVTDVGSYINASSYFGTYDQAGNLWEWTDTISSGNNRVLRGGAVYSNVNDLSAASGRGGSGPTDEGYYYGFRVASLTAVPEPSVWASAMGLTMFVFGVWVRRGRRTL